MNIVEHLKIDSGDLGGMENHVSTFNYPQECTNQMVDWVNLKRLYLQEEINFQLLRSQSKKVYQFEK